MIIKKLDIKRLHGAYNYSVDFNDELTFIYGENGCGKTTVLDIVSSIVTGKLYNLFSYKFDEVILSYRKKKKGKLDSIIIKAREDAYEITLTESKIQEIIESNKNNKDLYVRDESEYAFDQRFIGLYEVPRYLRKTFNYIYLPLSRNSQDGIAIGDSHYIRRRRPMMYTENDLVNKNYLNDSLRYVEEIVRSGCMRISSTENIINSKFRSNILTSSLKVTREYNVLSILDDKKSKTALSDIDKSKEEYIKTLQSIGEWNDETNKQVELFFTEYKSAFEKSQREDSQGNSRVTVDFLIMNMEFNRIKGIASQAQEIETEKEAARAPKTTFLNIVNEFLSIGEDKKQISINNEGKIVVEVKYPNRKLSLYNLSSGEKQIIIIFACLTFGLPTGQSGIYIVDEPEASLHLAWQKHFVESIKRINSSIQLIFATHAPEIIGRYAENTVKLIKKVDTNISKEDEMYDE